MSETSTLIGYGGRTIGREELALVPRLASRTTTRRQVVKGERLQENRIHHTEYRCD
jgi:hypothetical protein